MPSVAASTNLANFFIVISFLSSRVTAITLTANTDKHQFQIKLTNKLLHLPDT